MRLVLVLLVLVCATGCATFFSGPTPVERNIVFKELANGKSLKGDFYFPKTPGPHPAVVVVHGGGWIRRDGKMEVICKKLARAGYVAFNVTYRLAPEAHFPEPVEDVQDAIRFLQSHAHQYGVDRERIAAWGYSAGSNIVLLAALDGSMGVNAIVVGGTPADLTQWPGSPLVEEFIGKSYEDRPDLWAQASPVNHVTENSPPVFLYHGSWDEIVEIEQMRRLEKALDEKQRPHQDYVANFFGHFQTYLFSSESDNRALRFLNQNNQSRNTASVGGGHSRENISVISRVRSHSNRIVP